jgi:UDP-N-acetylmuramoyl-L-alanyl-D-glutamate--2,6-diaminopimelate ligase
LASLLARIDTLPGAESTGSPLPGVRIQGSTARPVAGLTHDSRAVARDWIFVALPGARFDGHDFVPRLTQAAAVVVEREVEAPPGVTVLRVADTRRALPWLAAAFYDHPGRRLPMAGATGTNGKTTATTMASAALLTADRLPGLVGTTGHRVGRQDLSIADLVGPALAGHHHTTPEAPTLQALLAGMADRGCDCALMEVSSIGLHAFRADAIPFRVAAFTNLTRDHLDYHGDMEAYAQAKERLFHELLDPAGLALLNRDDPAWERFRPAGRDTWTYGLEAGDLHTCGATLTAAGTRARVVTPSGSGELVLPLVGRHNLSNGLCALGMALGLGCPLDAALEGLAQLPPVAGRLEAVPNDRGLGVFVDYAHTPDALESVLRCLRELAPRRLITVFGCGGDRDQGKRAPMGRAAWSGSDLAVVTSDNPRSEDPELIVRQILEGIPSDASGLAVEVDRAAAIRLALEGAQPGDLVLIAGKGHETYQELAQGTIDFDDRLVARAVLEEGA